MSVVGSVLTVVADHSVWSEATRMNAGSGVQRVHADPGIISERGKSTTRPEPGRLGESVCRESIPALDALFPRIFLDAQFIRRNNADRKACQEFADFDQLVRIPARQ